MASLDNPQNSKAPSNKRSIINQTIRYVILVSLVYPGLVINDLLYMKPNGQIYSALSMGGMFILFFLLSDKFLPVNKKRKNRELWKQRK